MMEKISKRLIFLSIHPINTEHDYYKAHLCLRLSTPEPNQLVSPLSTPEPNQLVSPCQNHFIFSSLTMKTLLLLAVSLALVTVAYGVCDTDAFIECGEVYTNCTNGAGIDWVSASRI